MYNAGMAKKSKTIMTNEEIENAKPIAQLLQVQSDLNDVIETVIERDIRAGLYKLKAGPRKEQVKLLADQGLSNRKIAKVLGVDRRTVDRDVGGANAPSTGANAPFPPATDTLPDAPNGPLPSQPTSKASEEEIARAIEHGRMEALQEAELRLQEAEQKRQEAELLYEQQLAERDERLKALEEDKRNHNKQLQDIEEKYKNVTVITDIRPEPGFNEEFSDQITKLVRKILNFVNDETWKTRIRELETYKNDIRLTGELEDLNRLIGSFTILEQEAQKWRKQVTPTSDQWKNRSVKG